MTRPDGQRIRKAVIPAAGMGTRLLPATKALPKELLPLIDVPVIQLAVDDAVESGMDDVLVIVRRGKELLADHFDRQPELEALLAARGKTDALEAVRSTGAGATLHYTRQPDPKGLGHAVLMARHHVGTDPFAVMLPDDVMLGPRPILAQLEEHWVPGRCVVAVMPVPRAEAFRYGIVTPIGEKSGPAFTVADIVEKPDVSQVADDVAWAAMGRYLLDADVFDVLEHMGPGAGGEIQLTDGLRAMAEAGRLTAVAYEGERFDVGDRLGYLKAVISYGLYRPDFAPDLKRYLAELAQQGIF